jgi:tetratricopeptide (TPR) repeat protein
MKLGHFFRIAGHAVTAISVSGIACVSSAAQGNAGETKPIPLKSDSQVAFTLAPGESRNVAMALAGGEAATAGFEQVAGSISVTESCAGCVPQEPRTNAAGVPSTISFRIVGTDSAAVTFAVLNPSKTRAADVVAAVSLAHAVGEADRREVDAEASFARAEALRAKRDPASVDAAAAGYDHAIAIWREAGDTADATRALAWKAMLLGFVKNDLAAAQAVAKQALGSVAALHGAEAANCWKIAGYVAAGSSDYDAAEKDYTSALGLFQDTGDRLNQEILLDNKAKLARQRGRSDEALADAEEAAKIAREIGDVQRQLSIAEELGSIYTERGELRPAFEAYQSALELLKSTSYGPVEGYVWSDLGVLYTLLHEFDHALDALGQATAFWQKHPNLLGQINTLDDLGELYSEEGKPSRARESLAQGLAIADAHQLPRQQVYLLRAIGGSDLRARKMQAAQEALDKALALAMQIGQGDALGAVYCSLGDLSTARKRWPEAKARYEECLKAASEAKSQYDVIHAEGGLARVGLEAGELEDALSHGDAAIGDIEGVRGHLAEQDLKTAFFASMHDYYDLDIAILMRLDRRHRGGGYAWKAFEVSERARARQLLDQMLGAGATAEAVAGPLPLASIEERLLDRRTALLEYWIGARASYLWVVSREGFHSYRLAPGSVLTHDAADLSTDVLRSAAPPANVGAELREAAMLETETKLTHDAERVGAALLPPRSALHGVRRMLIVQDEAVLSVPFGMLRYPAPERGESAPLAARFVIASEPSAVALAELIERHRNPSADPRAMRIAVFADPASRGEAASTVAAMHAASYSRFDARAEETLPPLRFAEREAASIVAIYGHERATVMSGANASADAVKALDWTAYSVGHFATHAIVDQRHAELSGLLLSTGGRDDSRGRLLRYGEISRMRAPLELVVLSACDTANGEQMPGEGLLGLSYAFMAAGSQRVLGTLWKVDDEATAAWMALFYRGLKDSNSPAEALRQAQVKMAADPRWHSPYYWAGFSLQGNWHEFQ